MAHDTAPPVIVHVPRVDAADVSVSPATAGSVTVTSSASDGPALRDDDRVRHVAAGGRRRGRHGLGDGHVGGLADRRVDRGRVVGVTGSVTADAADGRLVSDAPLKPDPTRTTTVAVMVAPGANEATCRRPCRRPACTVAALDRHVPVGGGARRTSCRPAAGRSCGRSSPSTGRCWWSRSCRSLRPGARRARSARSSPRRVGRAGDRRGRRRAVVRRHVVRGGRGRRGRC